MPIEMMIRKLRLHSELVQDDLSALRSIVTPVKYFPQDAVIVREGDISTQSCVLMSGFAYRSKVSEHGKRQILSFHIAGDMPDLQGLLLKKMDHDLTTLSPAQVGFMSHLALRRAIAARPSLGLALWRETLLDSVTFRQWIVNLGTRTAAGRVAYLIAELHQRLGTMGLVKDEQFSFPVTQSKLAEALGLSIVHINRVLQSFRAQGVLDFRKQVVTLRDIEKIVELGGFDDGSL